MNNKFLSGPDLINQFAGALIRFHTHEAAFIGDIEAMYYQVQVPEEQRSVLRFLWWEDGNLGGDLPDHEMCVHVLVVPPDLDAVIMPCERQQSIMKLDMEKKHPKHCNTTSMWMISLRQ